MLISIKKIDIHKEVTFISSDVAWITLNGNIVN